MLPKVAGNFPTKIRAAYGNSYIFYKIFCSDAETFNGHSFTLMEGILKSTARDPLGPHTFLHKILSSPE